jgi:hypothetical protein
VANGQIAAAMGLGGISKISLAAMEAAAQQVQGITQQTREEQIAEIGQQAETVVAQVLVEGDAEARAALAERL